MLIDGGRALHHSLLATGRCDYRCLASPMSNLILIHLWFLILVFLGDYTGFQVLNKTMKVIAPPQQDLEWPSSVHKVYHSMRSMFHDITRLQPPIPEKVNTMMFVVIWVWSESWFKFVVSWFIRVKVPCIVDLVLKLVLKYVVLSYLVYSCEGTIVNKMSVVWKLVQVCGILVYSYEDTSR